MKPMCGVWGLSSSVKLDLPRIQQNDLTIVLHRPVEAAMWIQPVSATH